MPADAHTELSINQHAYAALACARMSKAMLSNKFDNKQFTGFLDEWRAKVTKKQVRYRFVQSGRKTAIEAIRLNEIIKRKLMREFGLKEEELLS